MDKKGHCGNKEKEFVVLVICISLQRHCGVCARTLPTSKKCRRNVFPSYLGAIAYCWDLVP